METRVSDVFTHDSQSSTGILVINLGTPDEPTPQAVRRYLKEFLWDPRIVSSPRLLWWLILQIILIIRPHKSARAYRKVWQESGSPLLTISRQQAQALQSRLNNTFSMPITVELGMRYGNPSIPEALAKLRVANAQRILVLPLYPQYSSCSTASTFDAIAQAVEQQYWVPEFRFVNQYHDFDLYITALAQSILDAWEEHGQGEMLLFSFHGTPKRLLLGGDPYHCQCQTTARLVAETLGLVESRWQVTFQSRFGREEWLQPYTIKTLETLGDSGLKSVDIVCPGFSADCLETLEEIARVNHDAFLTAGGKKFQYIPALNDRDDHIAALLALIAKNTQGWLSTDQAWDAGKQRQFNLERSQRAKALGAER